MSRYHEIDLNKISTYSIKDRPSKVRVSALAKKYQLGSSIKHFISSLPDILIAADLKQLIKDIGSAYKTDKQIIFMMGAHVIKCGLNPLLIQLMENGIIKSLALNGAGVIHDTEMAFWGTTSEDVEAALADGSFGMVKETPHHIFSAAKKGQSEESGFGEAVGKYILESDAEFKEISLLAQAYRLEIPVTVHVAIGTDIIHQHPTMDGAMIGELSFRDFKIFAHQVSLLDKGAIVLNVGSAVLMPEVFLKALTIARNLGYPAHGFITANFDHFQLR
ncbi:hypothetical protein B6D60_11410 [candidate division KSB1 bacterium 4484_87]|nr:MAG: hypothetical protein B6D60_11410 [candidate division KSB1 bacterium 4484_87]